MPIKKLKFPLSGKTSETAGISVFILWYPYERYFWNSAEYIRDYIKKITKKELTFNQCIGILYECLMRQMFPGREKGNEKVVEKFIPCNKKISEIRKEITKDIGRSEEDKEKDKKKDKKNGKYEQIIDKVKEYFF